MILARYVGMHVLLQISNELNYDYALIILQYYPMEWSQWEKVHFYWWSKRLQNKILLDLFLPA
jgi:intergrase/recombinase